MPSCPPPGGINSTVTQRVKPTNSIQQLYPTCSFGTSMSGSKASASSKVTTSFWFKKKIPWEVFELKELLRILHIFPLFFQIIVRLSKWHPNKQIISSNPSESFFTCFFSVFKVTTSPWIFCQPRKTTVPFFPQKKPPNSTEKFASKSTLRCLVSAWRRAPVGNESLGFRSWGGFSVEIHVGFFVHFKLELGSDFFLHIDLESGSPFCILWFVEVVSWWHSVFTCWLSHPSEKYAQIGSSPQVSGWKCHKIFQTTPRFIWISFR